MRKPIHNHDEEPLDHKGCGGVLVKIWTGHDEFQIRCQYCKKALTEEELISHGFNKKKAVIEEDDFL